MIIDFRESPDFSEYAFDVCIIGAGAAGITLAKSLARQHHLRIGVIESGTLSVQQDTQELYSIESVGHPYFEPDGSRMRMFGGSTNHWGGQVLPLAPSTFEPRPWLDDIGWPIERAVLEPYYSLALKDLSIPAEVLEKEFRNGLMVGRAWLPDDNDTENRLKFISRNFLPEVYEQVVEPLANVLVVLNANLTSIETSTAGDAHRTSSIRINDLSMAKEARISAKCFVLACGGIENARVLLNAQRNGVGGMGNDLTGRYFQDHPHLISAFKLYSSADLFDSYAYYDASDITCVGNAVLSQSAQRRGGAMAAALSCAYSSELYEEPGRTWRQYDVSVQSEQKPDADSRILLGSERDRLGQWKTVVDWRLNDIDLHTLRTATEVFAAKVGRLGLGRVKLDRIVHEGAWSLSNVTGGAHHMGTTRMAQTASSGVVDTDCRLFGNDNFYVAGSSVFPTGGYENPTLTVIALAHRLSEHLQNIVSR